MSELAKQIGRVQRREVTGGMGFAVAKRQQPRAMLLAALVPNAGAAKEAFDAGADTVIFEGLDAAKAAAELKQLGKATSGVRLSSFDEQGAQALREAGCDFVVSGLAETSSAAVDIEAMGQLVVADSDVSDTTLRALGPLGFDALFVEGHPEALTLAAQLELVRMSSFASLPLAVAVTPGAPIAQLRALRDSGVAIAVAPTGTSAADLKALGDRLREIPAPKRGGKGREIALIPALTSHAEDEEDDDHDH